MFVDIKEPSHLGEAFHLSYFFGRGIHFELEKAHPCPS